MEHSTTKRWVYTALFAAMSAMATMVLCVPTPTGGYVNFGDIVVILGGLFLGPWFSAIAGGVGSAMADMLLGYTIYAPATFIIKGAMGLAVGLLSHRLGQKPLVCALAVEPIMIVGYWCYDGFLSGSLLAAAPGIFPNVIQGVFAVVGATALALALGKTPLRHSFCHAEK